MKAALAFVAFALAFTSSLIWVLASWYMAAGWALLVLTGVLVWVISLDDRERRRAEERELLARALRISEDPWDSLPDRCHEAPDPYRKEAA
ncbi:MAG: hypothetical protein E6Q97_23315 [Desulfurellales bacterium]|nr:MAG: hypothetical protein E6Q97_23315 [Desulfurellales bacterium]